MTRVMKFGGTSVGDAACMRQVAALVQGALASGPLVVLSAMAKTTDALFRAARAAAAGQLDAARSEVAGVERSHRATAEALFGGAVPDELERAFATHFGDLDRTLHGVALLRELTPRSQDAIAARGELLSTSLFAALCRSLGMTAEWFDAREVMRTDARFGEAQPDPAAIRALAAEKLGPRLGAGRVLVTQGYIGATGDGSVTTLGRGGSDYSASLLGAALGCDEVQIWTDVEGVFTADPRVVKTARPIAQLSFDEAAELAAFGAKVLHPATIQPAVEARIPVTVRHTQRPEGRFTTIRERCESERPVTALASRGPVHVITLASSRMLEASGFLARIFDVFGALGVSVDVVATAEVAVSVTVEADAPLDVLQRELGRFATVEVRSDRAIVALVGGQLKRTPRVAAAALAAVDELEVEMLSMGANEINLTLVVPRRLEQDTVRRLHERFFPA